jgi:hypothetical protein
MVAVGTLITERPPAQIRTSASTHTALVKDEWRRSGREDTGLSIRNIATELKLSPT